MGGYLEATSRSTVAGGRPAKRIMSSSDNSSVWQRARSVPKVRTSATCKEVAQCSLVDVGVLREIPARQAI